MSGPSRPDLPDIVQSRLVAEWLAGARGRLLRRAQVGRRASVLEVGCGHGLVTEELIRRAPGAVVCVDRVIEPAAHVRSLGARLVAADAARLPFPDGTFDLAFCQNVLLWVGDAELAVRELARALQPGGVLVALEPDFGGMMEHPPQVALRDLWLRGLRQAGANPEIGRALPGTCEAAGLDTWVELQPIPQPATPEAVHLLADLSLSDEDAARLRRVEEAIAARTGKWSVFVHVPYVLVVATKPSRPS
ncbi:MAG: class I SAM-dependent methyltransferase [Armatimonadota bacterium]